MICCIANICNVRILRAGQIWPFCHHRCALMGVVGEVVQGVLVVNKRGGRKSVHDGGYDRVTGLNTIF